MKIFTHIAKLIPIIIFAIGLTATAPIEDDIRTIEIIGMDNMRFDITDFQVEPGEKIRLVLKVESRMPAQVMAHNVAIVESDIDMRTFILESQRASDNEFISPNFEDQVIAKTEMIGGGETSEVIFTVPDQPGNYPFVCTWPGHYAAGMVGNMIVIDKSITEATK